MASPQHFRSTDTTNTKDDREGNTPTIATTPPTQPVSLAPVALMTTDVLTPATPPSEGDNPQQTTLVAPVATFTPSPTPEAIAAGSPSDAQDSPPKDPSSKPLSKESVDIDPTFAPNGSEAEPTELSNGTKNDKSARYKLAAKLGKIKKAGSGIVAPVALMTRDAFSPATPPPEAHKAHQPPVTAPIITSTLSSTPEPDAAKPSTEIQESSPKSCSSSKPSSKKPVDVNPTSDSHGSDVQPVDVDPKQNAAAADMARYLLASREKKAKPAQTIAEPTHSKKRKRHAEEDTTGAEEIDREQRLRDAELFGVDTGAGGAEVETAAVVEEGPYAKRPKTDAAAKKAMFQEKVDEPMPKIKTASKPKGTLLQRLKAGGRKKKVKGPKITHY